MWKCGEIVFGKRAVGAGTLKPGPGCGESVRGDSLRSKLEYKCRWQGRVFIPVPARQTSQTCSHCGATDPESRVSRDTFRCT